MTDIRLIIRPGGIIQGLYQEALPLLDLGHSEVRRASHVEPDEDGRHWYVDLSPIGDNSCLGKFQTRSEALHAEAQWLLNKLRQRKL